MEAGFLLVSGFFSTEYHLVARKSAIVLGHVCQAKIPRRPEGISLVYPILLSRIKIPRRPEGILVDPQQKDHSGALTVD